MRIMTPEQFQKCPQGTVFAFGPRWAFSAMLILDEVILGDGFWGFYATDPVWVEAEDCMEAGTRLDEMAGEGASYPVQTSSSRYMTYDGDNMDWFLVFEKADWDALNAMVAFPDQPKNDPTPENSA